MPQAGVKKKLQYLLYKIVIPLCLLLIDVNRLYDYQN